VTLLVRILTALLMLVGPMAAQAQLRGDPATYDRELHRAHGPLTAADVFNPAVDASAEVDAAIARARARGRHTLIVFGGAWCHDSAALVDLFSSERFEFVIWPRYELVYVDTPFERSARNHALARRFGLGDIVGTPTVLILAPDGTPTNLADAPQWRNAASRKPEAIFRYFSRRAPVVEGNYPWPHPTPSSWSITLMKAWRRCCLMASTKRCGQTPIPAICARSLMARCRCAGRGATG
jgi:hypothetical protein